MTMLKRLLSTMALLVLAACGGGGGDPGAPPFSGGGSGGGSSGGGETPVTGTPVVTLALSSTTITQQAPATLTATVRDAAGNPVSGSVVTLRTVRSDIGQLTASSVLTDASGNGSVTLQAAVGGVIGADEVQATATLGTTTVNGRIGFAVTAASVTINAAISSNTLRGSAGPATFTAIVRDATGAPLSGQLVSFGSAGGVVTLGAASALTDAGGSASTSVSPANASVGVADTLVASVSINERVFQTSVNVQVIAESPSIAMALTSTTATQAAPASVTATVRDPANNPVRDAVVGFSTQFGLGAYSVNTALTGADGTATVTLAPRTGTTAGADVAVASVTLGGVTRTAQRALEFRAGSSAGEPVLQVALAPSIVTPTTPATVTVTLRDGLGNPVRGNVINLSTQRGNLATLSAASVLTAADGTASVTLRSSNAVVVGADEVVATTILGGASLQGRAGFEAQSASPTLALTPQSQSASTTAPLTLQATLRRADGSLAVGQLVSFSSAAGLARLSAAQAITNGVGVATVQASPLAPSTSGEDVITATATLDGRTLQSQSGVQLLAQAPSITIASVTSTEASAAAPVTMRAVVRDLGGDLLPNALVSFGSALNLASFTPVTTVTNAQGEASTVVGPRLATSAGSDLISASVTVSGMTASAQRSLTFIGAAPSGNPTLDMTLSSDSISAASPATITARLQDAIGSPISGQVVTFAVVRGLAVTNVETALTNASGVAQVVLSPASSVAAGADEITATVNYAGASLQRTRGFQVQATPVTLTAFTSAADPLAAYGQTTLTLLIGGAGVTSPVNISVSSSCVSQAKATLSPSTFTATSSTVTMQYRDNGCGAIQASDQLLAVVTSTGLSRSLALDIQSPGESSVGFVSASPEQIFLRGSGFVESSIVTFEVRDAAGNPLPNRLVELRLQTGAGDVTMEGRGVESVNPPSAAPFTLTSNAQGRVSVRVNSGTLPTPVRINARLAGSSIATVSSNLSVAVGLPSQLNFSLSQGTRNIEGFNIDGTPNTYQVIAADRSGNPVPNGTSINFVTEGGQVESIRQTTVVNGIARTVAQFVSADPRPVDGRVTITAYALGEESFIDLNGNNVYDAGEPFQDLGNIFKDRNFDGVFDGSTDEFVPLAINNSSLCAALPAAYLPILGLDAGIPSVGGRTCDSRWSGTGQIYVRRATETVLSTSGARALWAGTSGLDATCRKIDMQVGNLTTQTDRFTRVAGDTWYGGRSGTLSFIAADANPGNQFLGLLPRLNPMAAGTTITAASPTAGVTVTVGGSPVPSTTAASGASVAYSFGPTAPASGVVLVTFTSPSGTATTYGITIDTVTPRPTVCP